MSDVGSKIVINIGYVIKVGNKYMNECSQLYTLPHQELIISDLQDAERAYADAIEWYGGVSQFGGIKMLRVVMYADVVGEVQW